MDALFEAARRVIARCYDRGMTIATAESCTGGLIAKVLTDIPGCSAVFAGACVTYTNAVKEALLGVDPAIIDRDTEVSHACAAAMAVGVRERLGVDAAVSTTGFAGPGGGTPCDPVGTVYIGISTAAGVRTERFSVPDPSSRTAVRESAALRALQLLEEAI